MTRLLDDLLDLFLPASCVACGVWGAMLCARCALALAGPAFPVVPPPSGAPPCWAGGRYDGPLRAAILAYKERGRHSLIDPLGALLATAVTAACASRVSAVVLPGAPAGLPPGSSADVRAGVPAGSAGQIWLVPVPSTASAVRARGGDHLRALALSAARALRGRGQPARVVPMLVARGRRLDSVGLDAAARRANVAGGFRLGRRFAAPPRAPSGDLLVLVDDLVTTGATLAEAARTLAAGGWPVRRAAVLAATVRRAAGSGDISNTRVGSSPSVPVVSPRRGASRALSPGLPR